jgi:hypothetical protein
LNVIPAEFIGGHEAYDIKPHARIQLPRRGHSFGAKSPNERRFLPRWSVQIVAHNVCFSFAQLVRDEKFQISLAR